MENFSFYRISKHWRNEIIKGKDHKEKEKNYLLTATQFDWWKVEKEFPQKKVLKQTKQQ